MHHGFKRFEDYAPWLGLYFTVTGDVHYFKFWRNIATLRQTFQSEGGLIKFT